MLKCGHCQTAPAKVSLWEATVGNTALDHQNYYEWQRNDVLSRWRLEGGASLFATMTIFVTEPKIEQKSCFFSSTNLWDQTLSSVP
jgi:hypothetical protein